MRVLGIELDDAGRESGRGDRDERSQQISEENIEFWPFETSLKMASRRR